MKLNVLVVGAGPAGITTVINLDKICTRVGLAIRESNNSSFFMEELNKNKGLISSVVEDDRYKNLEGEKKLEDIYESFDEIEDIWDAVVLCIPFEAYVEVVKKLFYLKKIETVILISSSIGSSLLVSSYMREEGRRVEVVSLSTYYAASKRYLDKYRTKIITKGVKKKVYIGSMGEARRGINLVKVLLGEMEINYEELGTPMEAESRNINLYVHPPLCINKDSLDYIFGKKDRKLYIYKIYPEGPICQEIISNMLSLWKELSKFLEKLNLKSFNLLKFLNDDNYPVLEKSLNRVDIDNFDTLPRIYQEYLLYIRYTSILIDPHSKADQEGKFRDFSAFPFTRIYEEKGLWNIPRVPFEDYKKLKLIYNLAEKLGFEMPIINKFITLFEEYIFGLVEEKSKDKVNKMIFYKELEEDTERILRERSYINE